MGKYNPEDVETHTGVRQNIEDQKPPIFSPFHVNNRKAQESENYFNVFNIWLYHTCIINGKSLLLFIINFHLTIILCIAEFCLQKYVL